MVSSPPFSYRKIYVRNIVPTFARQSSTRDQQRRIVMSQKKTCALQLERCRKAMTLHLEAMTAETAVSAQEVKRSCDARRVAHEPCQMCGIKHAQDEVDHYTRILRCKLMHETDTGLFFCPIWGVAGWTVDMSQADEDTKRKVYQANEKEKQQREPWEQVP
eukprot:GEMP01090324.1.p1 GENE.GEMP01090324.1~~GEMP01090324.1.p1  ORF type:complete len:169 (+),score=16.93 GEMP01090324.1:27-509(+)